MGYVFHGFPRIPGAPYPNEQRAKDTMLRLSRMSNRELRQTSRYADNDFGFNSWFRDCIVREWDRRELLRPATMPPGEDQKTLLRMAGLGDPVAASTLLRPGRGEE